MSESDQFRQYAEEALLWAAQSKTEEEKRLLLELVRTWRQAAIVSAVVDNQCTGASAGGDFSRPRSGVPCHDCMKTRHSTLSILQRRMPISWRLSWDATEAPMRFSGASFG